MSIGVLRAPERRGHAPPPAAANEPSGALDAPPMETCRVTLFPEFPRCRRAVGLASSGGAGRLLEHRGMLRRRQGRLPLDVSTRTTGLEVPPDLTQLAKDTRYQPSTSGVISASTFQTAPALRPALRPRLPPACGAPAAPARGRRRRGRDDADDRADAVGSFKIERLGNDRWLSTTLTPEQVYPAGAHLLEGQRLQPRPGPSGSRRARDRLGREPRQAAAATSSAHRSASCSRTAYSDQRARQVPHPGRAHARPAATSTSPIAAWKRSTSASARSRTVWQPRPADPSARGRVPVPPDGRSSAPRTRKPRRSPPPRPTAPPRGARRRARARARPTGRRRRPCRLDDGFDRAWRRVGLALDRSGFTVEDRDRGPGRVLRALRRPGLRRPRGAQLLQPRCSASARRTTPAAWPSTASRSRPKATHQHGRRPRFAGQARDAAKPASGSSACSSTTCTVTRRGAQARAARDPLLQPRQRQRRQRHRRRGDERHHDDAPARRRRLLAHASSTSGWRAPASPPPTSTPCS